VTDRHDLRQGPRADQLLDVLLCLEIALLAIILPSVAYAGRPLPSISRSNKPNRRLTPRAPGVYALFLHASMVRPDRLRQFRAHTFGHNSDASSALVSVFQSAFRSTWSHASRRELARRKRDTYPSRVVSGRSATRLDAAVSSRISRTDVGAGIGGICVGLRLKFSVATNVLPLAI
jgi:hypothetical protein